MLAYNDKWWRYKYDDTNLRRFGDKKREEMSCIPVDLRGKCLYCNGQYDNKIETELGRRTSGAMTGHGPWIE
ncbi:uncharacterized protein ColSpa_12203 [Colletotrichum spaethianum]|uniref:Uncharacterized protein n=1 Tax=Colletotrichum spaethianum TaxID=700344 RepID=A0AA37US60_9PEZI|nr:uncharacterized protein ColSpa_12203 [Colletotrichum spaethianum]GKT52022.1 hypothetical protein ColSpa_12203 [Colletotrichum spaethianum]GKT61206.1 hypothetical protein ColTof3_08545 [Colletotrichum tofieldiae]GKT68874.1 hypothetical protein ColTof4_01297 [Colletotrichum tofieldiae]